jgi:PKD repeat protein
MKKIILILFLALLVFLSSCEEEKNPPVASFQHSSNSYEIGDTIYFTSTSELADEYEWNFGDGNSSTEENPFHIYDLSWSYNVTLKVTNKDGSNETSENINIKDPTVLAFHVTYNGEDFPLCIIQLYESEEDWLNYDNIVMQNYTDLEGRLEFFHVKPIKYYLDALGWVVKGPDVHELYGGGSIPKPVESNQRTEYQIILVPY